MWLHVGTALFQTGTYSSKLESHGSTLNTKSWHSSMVEPYGSNTLFLAAKAISQSVSHSFSQVVC